MRFQHKYTNNKGELETFQEFEKTTTETECDELGGLYKDGVCTYKDKTKTPFYFNYVRRKGQILEINGTQTTSSDIIIKTDYDLGFNQGDTIYSNDGSKIGKIFDTETEYLNQQGNRRGTVIRKVWKVFLS